jgi:hypothetical protein
MPKSDFKVIHSPSRLPVTGKTLSMPPQGELFKPYESNILIFVSFPRTTAAEFLMTVAISNPQVVLDLRRYPRFDFGHLSRKLVFNEFEKREVRYIDFAWTANCDREHAFPLIGPELPRMRGCIMALVDEAEECDLIEAVTTQFKSVRKRKWKIASVPQYLEPQEMVG